MNQALYRKYRPNNFNDVYGQEPIVKILKSGVREKNFSHAYLFCGPRGTGKTSVARILAKAVNCEKQNEGNPDNACNSCVLINEFKALDILEIDAASHTQVDNIREVIIDRANFAPTSLKYKVYIIDEAHMLSKSSFNALLKTLEEPPVHTILILATTEINKIPATIASRCQRFDFKRINTVDLVKRLKFIAKEEKINVDDEAIELIAKLSEGSFRDAISLLDQVSISGQKIGAREVETLLGFSDLSMLEDLTFALVEKDPQKGFEIISRVIDDGLDMTQFTKNLIEYLRNVLLASVSGLAETNLSKEASEKVSEIINIISTEEIIKIIDTIIENERLYRYAFLPELGLEVSIVKATKLYVSDPIVVKKTNERANEAGKIAQKNKTVNNHNGTWQQLLLEVKTRNNSIHAFLKVCEPEFDGKSVCLNFPYKFHKERIEDPKNRRIVEEAMKRVYGEEYKIKCVIRPNAKNNEIQKPKNDDLLEDALEIFGGEVVE